MTEYGVQKTGYVRKPLAVILAELEAAMITEFGPGVIQTSQSPFGQLNGLAADLVAEIDERNLDLYQSYDPDQAEGFRLEMLGRLRLVGRATRQDEAYRKAITNAGEMRIDLQDFEQALRNVDGVSFAKVYDKHDWDVLGPGALAVAVIGGDDGEVGDVMRKYVVPGIDTSGNYRVTSDATGRCRSFSLIRPIEVPVTLDIVARGVNIPGGCPTPSHVAIEQALVAAWLTERSNGRAVDHFALRSIIERKFPGVSVENFVGQRDGLVMSPNTEVTMDFTEIASLTLGGTHVDLL
jgi:hypothetical protein